MVDRYLFLDDERMPGDVTWCELPSAQYVVVRNFDEFVKHVLTFGIPRFVAFDHDLADFHYKVGFEELRASEPWRVQTDQTFDYGPEKTGYDCAKWLVDFCEERGLKFPDYTIHSLNPIGKLRISNYIDNAKQHLNI
jgi:hypothetical protein